MILANGTIRIPGLSNCNGTSVIDADANGNLVCGADSGGSASPGGISGNIQFNDGASGFTADPIFTYNDTKNFFGVGTATPYSVLSVWGQATGNIFEVISNASSTLIVVSSTGNVGIGTTSPNTLLQLFSSATTTLSIDATSTTQGGCIEIKDRDGTGYTYIYANNGVIYSDTISCK